jgi:anaerobic magnesium-protoporphyrin IX monomethyl ester cyclase
LQPYADKLVYIYRSNSKNQLQKPTVVLYNPKAVFYTMPLALLAIGSFLDREKYNVVIIDGRLEEDPIAKIFSLLQNA